MPAKPSASEHPVSCRICESRCGLLATVEATRVTRLRPDPEHPVSRGYACPKGPQFTSTLDRPDRLLAPHLGSTPTTWSAALAFVRDRVHAAQRAHGRTSVGLYLGNAVIHNFGAVLGTQVLARALGTSRVYSSLSLDNVGQYYVLDRVTGSPVHSFVADYASSDCTVLFGTDPLSSQPSQAQSNPRGVQELLRGTRPWVVDPRPSATARHGEHLAVRPGSDVHLLGFLLGRLLRENRSAHGTAALAPALVSFTLERAAAATGLPPERLEALARALLAARNPLAWCGLGVLLGPGGTLGYWLTLCIQAALDGIGPGRGWRYNPGAVDLAAIAAGIGVRGIDASRASPVGGYPSVLGALPAATMAADIARSDRERLRALVVIGGNPVAACPDRGATAAALASLELLVVVDPFPSETAALAHLRLPPTLWPERADLDLHMCNQRPTASLQLDRAVVPPPGQCRDDWDIAIDLAAAGAQGIRGRAMVAAARVAGWKRMAQLAIAARAPWSWGELEAAPRGLDAPIPAAPLPRLDLVVPEFLRALAAHPLPRPDPPGTLRVVSSVRPPAVMNSWLGAPPAGAVVHPSDLAALSPGATLPAAISLRGAAEIVVDARADAALAPGTVVLPWAAGVANRVIAARELDPFTGAPVSNGQPVAALPAPPVALTPPGDVLRPSGG